MKIIKYFIEYVFILALLLIFKIIGYKNASNLGEKIGKIIVQNQDDLSNLEFIEKWDSKEHYEKYLQWRVESGVMGAFSSKYLDEEPVWRYFDLVSEF